MNCVTYCGLNVKWRIRYSFWTSGNPGENCSANSFNWSISLHINDDVKITKFAFFNWSSNCKMLQKYFQNFNWLHCCIIIHHGTFHGQVSWYCTAKIYAILNLYILRFYDVQARDSARGLGYDRVPDIKEAIAYCIIYKISVLVHKYACLFVPRRLSTRLTCYSIQQQVKITAYRGVQVEPMSACLFVANRGKSVLLTT